MVATSCLGVSVLFVSACGGGGDSSSTTTNPAVITQPPTVAPLITEPPVTLPPVVTTPPTVALVTEGAVVLVANASGIDGAAGRLSDRLAAAGFTMGAATNSSTAVSNLAVTQVYYVAGDPAALAVAQSVQAVLGGGAVELLELSLPAPTQSGDVGDAGVLVLMGNDVADKSLEELQGLAPATTEPTSGGTTDTTGG
jgi:hypothetical protein